MSVPTPTHREFSPGRKGIAETYRGEFELVGAKLPLAASTDKPGRLARLIVQGVNWFALVGRGGP